MEKLDEILIVEDEPLIAEDIAETLKDAGYGIAGVAHNSEKAVSILEESSPSLALLDIQIDGEINGLGLAEIINEKFQIPFIFLTSFTDESTLRKVRGLKPYGFIVKPFDDKELVTNVQLAISKYKEGSSQFAKLENAVPDAFFLRQNGVLVKVQADEILYAQAFDNYCYIFAKRKKYLVPNTLKFIEQKLDPNIFFRIHRSYLVNLRAVDIIDEQHIVVNKRELPLSKGQKHKLLNRIEML